MYCCIEYFVNPGDLQYIIRRFCNCLPPRMFCPQTFHDDVIKWKHFPRYWPFVRGINRSPANSPHKGQWRGALMFSLICARINGWVNNRQAGHLRCHRARYDVIVMLFEFWIEHFIIVNFYVNFFINTDDSGFAIGCVRNDWCSRLITCLLYISPLDQNLVLNTN